MLSRKAQTNTDTVSIAYTAYTRPMCYLSNRCVLPRKEVIHAQLPLRMPCYDLAPIIEPTLFPAKGFRVFSTLLA